MPHIGMKAKLLLIKSLTFWDLFVTATSTALTNKMYSKQGVEYNIREG